MQITGLTKENAKNYFMSDVSCFQESDGQINSMLLFHERPSGALAIQLMAFIGKDNMKSLPQMLYHALTEKLFPNGFGIPIFGGSRKEFG
jgi:hypothetical protein